MASTPAAEASGGSDVESDPGEPDVDEISAVQASRLALQAQRAARHLEDRARAEEGPVPGQRCGTCRAPSDEWSYLRAHQSQATQALAGTPSGGWCVTCGALVDVSASFAARNLAFYGLQGLQREIDAGVDEKVASIAAKRPPTPPPSAAAADPEEGLLALTFASLSINKKRHMLELLSRDSSPVFHNGECLCVACKDRAQRARNVKFVIVYLRALGPRGPRPRGWDEEDARPGARWQGGLEGHL